ncbi:hypothetical protein VE00_08521 [Pseudogymnoascus sp. WSF 3629]|nr:hypothetical protein VE00_08521 [Pseudogymnoascus sp. WSF 3629]
MSFKFIENDKIDGPARKRIRSHVMKGKNVGKVRALGTRIGESEDTYSDMTEILSIPRAVGNSFSLLSFPCELQPHMRDLIHRFASVGVHAVYPTEFCLPMNDIGHVWFRYLLRDEAFFHSVLAMSHVHEDSLLGSYQTSQRALWHLSNTYRCIKQNLEKHSTPSDSTVAAVMSMAIHEDLIGHPGRSRVHVEALQHIVELRGGITHFTDNQLLLQKICRADLQYALHDGAYPRFNPNNISPLVIRSTFGQLVPLDELSNLAHNARVYDPVLRGVFIDLMSISHFFNDSRVFVKLDPYAYQEILIIM